MTLIQRVKKLKESGEWDNNIEAWDTAFINEAQKVRGNSKTVRFDLRRRND